MASSDFSLAFSQPRRNPAKPWLFVGLWAVVLLGFGLAGLLMGKPAADDLSPVLVDVPPIAPLLVAGQMPTDHALSPAPDARITEDVSEGKLPVVAGGLSPLNVYNYPFNPADTRPRIAVVLTGAGPQTEQLTKALEVLPGSVGVALSPVTPDMSEKLRAVRAAGHETLLSVPMESADTDHFDPGPGALRRSLTAEENLHRLRLLMAEGSGYLGLALDPSAGLLDNTLLNQALLDEAKRRGLLWLAPGDTMTNFSDMGMQSGAAVVSGDVVRLDDVLTPGGLEAAFLRLETMARMKGQAVAVGAPYPLLVERLSRWLPSLEEKGLALAPISALAAPREAAH